MCNKEMFARFLPCFLNQNTSLTIGDSVEQAHYTLNFKHLANFLDLDKAAALLSQLGTDEPMDEEQRLAVLTFNQQYLIFKDGNDPDRPFARFELTQD